MPDFDWRTGDLERWDDPPFGKDQDRKRRPWWSKWLPFLFFLLVGGWLVSSQVNQWIDTAVIRAKEPPLTTFNLWHDAIIRGDEELFNLLLYDHNDDWLTGQQLLFDRELLLERRSLGLYHTPDQPEIVAVELTPDLTQATITYQQTYTALVGAGLTQTVTLEHTAALRYRQQQWQVAPLIADEWGGWVVSEGEILTLIYPERDERLGQRLAHDLDEQMRRMCATLTGVDCPADLRVVGRMKKSSISLAQVADQEMMLSGGLDINLPAPTLVGLPLDEAGYQALLRGYGSLIVTAVLTHLVDWDCCQHALFYQALLAKQLSQLNLHPWPLNADQYGMLLDYHFNIGKLDHLWRQESLGGVSKADRWLVYAFIDFLTESENQAAVAEMQRQLTQQPTYRQWIEQFVTETHRVDDALRVAWMQFVYNQTELSKAVPYPIPQTMSLLCASGQGIYRYDLGANAWTKVRDVKPETITLMTPLPAEAGLVLYEQYRTSDQESTWTILWRNGTETILQADALNAAFHPFYRGASLPGQRLVLVAPVSEQFPLMLFDQDNCGKLNCNLIPITAVPLWSPDSAYAILNNLEGETISLTLADSQGQPLRPIGAGRAPFWLDGETFGYVRMSSQAAEIVVRRVRDEAGRSLLTNQDLLQTFPTGTRPSGLILRQAFVSPANPNLIFIDAATPDQHEQYVFSYDRQTAEIMRRLTLDGSYTFMDFRLSPDGRYWTLNTHNRSHLIGTDWALFLHDVQQSQTRKLAFNPVSYANYSYDWSADGRWFVKVEPTFISLIAPDRDYRKIIFYQEPLCTTAVWVHGW